jgi:sialidase-1
MNRIFFLYGFLFFSLSMLAQEGQYFREVPLFVNGQDGYACYRIPAIIKAPNGDLLAFAEGRVNGCSDFGNVDIVLKRSTDNGLTWSASKLVADNGVLQAGNPAPVVDMLDAKFEHGRIFLCYNTGTASEYEVRQGKGIREVWYITSEDNGHSWSTPTNITQQVHRINNPEINSTYQHRDDWRSYANTPGHAIQLTKGKHAGRIFIPANHSHGAPQDNFNDYQAHSFFSDDHGKTWQLGASVGIPSSNESIAVELGDGSIMQNIRHQNGKSRQRIVALSSDGGMTWDSTYFEKQLPSPVCQASILSYTTPRGDSVLLFSNPANPNSRHGMRVRVSYDEGKTWLFSRLVREGESAYSDLVAQADQQIGLLYEHGNDGGIHYTHFNYSWLIGGQNNTDNPWVKKLTQPDLANGFQFQLADPILEYEEVFFKASTSIAAKLDYKGTKIHYTLDGSTPGEHSPVYTHAIELSQNATVKFRAFHPNSRPSNVVSQRFFKISDAKPIEYLKMAHFPSEQYPGDGAKTLVDLKKGSLNFREPAWLGFSGADVDLVIGFGKEENISKITASMLVDPGSWIFQPQSIELWSSSDGATFEKMGEKQLKALTENSASGLNFFDLEVPTFQSKFIKVVLKNIPQIPDWHPGAGTPAWLFVDEILID